MKKLFTLVLAAFMGVSLTSAMIGCSGTPAKKPDEKKAGEADKKPTTDDKDKKGG